MRFSHLGKGLDNPAYFRPLSETGCFYRYDRREYFLSGRDGPSALQYYRQEAVILFGAAF